VWKYSVPFIMSQSIVALSHRKSAFLEISRDSCRAQRHFMSTDLITRCSPIPTIVTLTPEIQGGSNMTRTDCV
jgi:hypothetical protein